MSISSIILLSDTSGHFNMVGEAFRADGWYGLYGGVHTVAIHYHNLTGRVYIEASLAVEPTEADWFPIQLTTPTPYVAYPRDPVQLQTGSPISYAPDFGPIYPPSGYGPFGDTGVEAFIFQGNVMWLRARLDRTYLLLGNEPTDPDLIANYGVIKQVLLNL